MNWFPRRHRRGDDHADLTRSSGLGELQASRSRPLSCSPLPTAADLAAEADRLAEMLVTRGAVDEFDAHVTDELFDQMLHDARVALAMEIDEQAAADDRLVDQGRVEWLACRDHSLALGTEVERLERLRDHHFTRITGLPASPQLPTADDDPTEDDDED